MQHSCKYAHILTVLLKAKKYILHQFLLILSMQTYELASIFGSAVIASHKKKKRVLQYMIKLSCQCQNVFHVSVATQLRSIAIKSFTLMT